MNAKAKNHALINLAFMGRKPTGLATYALNLVPELILPEVTLLAPFVPANTIHSCYKISEHLTSEYGTQGHLRRLLWTQFQLPKLYRELQADLLFSLVPEAPLISKCRSIIMVHDLIPLHFSAWKSPLKYYFQYYVPLVLQQAEHVICNSQATADDIVRFCGVSAQKISSVLLSHDVHHFRFLDLPTRNYFIYIGRSDPHKNLHRLLTAFSQLPDAHAYELLIVGSADRRYTPGLTAQAAELGLSDQIKFLDYVPYDALPHLINQAIALVFPSLWEGFGLPVLEAMACGTPVITSNLASMPEVAGGAAILVDPYNVSDIAAAMQTVATDGQVRSHLRRAGIARASQFSWAKTGQQTRDILMRYLYNRG